MNINEAVETLWQTIQSGQYPPPGLEKALTFADAYKIQLAILERHMTAGEQLAGWKVGLSSMRPVRCLVLMPLSVPICLPAVGSKAGAASTVPTFASLSLNPSYAS